MNLKNKIFLAAGIYLLGTITTTYLYESNKVDLLKNNLNYSIEKLINLHKNILNLFKKEKLKEKTKHTNQERIEAVNVLNDKEQDYLEKIKAANINILPYQQMPDETSKKIIKKSKKAGLNSQLMLAIAQMESGGNHNAISRTGAVGIFQFTYNTAQNLNLNNRFDIDENIEAGIKLTKLNIADLKKNKIKINAENIYLVHQLGLGNALEILAQKDKKIEQLTDKTKQAVKKNIGGKEKTVAKYLEVNKKELYKAKLALN